jgi:hypothetical protein
VGAGTIDGAGNVGSTPGSTEFHRFVGSSTTCPNNIAYDPVKETLGTVPNTYQANVTCGILTAGIWSLSGVVADSDSDTIKDNADNCLNVSNLNQRDTNADGYGNICDPDFNGDLTVNINDFNRLKARLNITPVVDVDTDLDGNGAVNINDFNRLKSFLGKPPGPSGLKP